jgi:formate dehydrogenase iron-sulfur subunit
MSSLRLFIPQDTTACALGADETAVAVAAAAEARGLDITLIRNGSRGLFWLEPLLEVETQRGERIAFGPAMDNDIPGILDALSADVTTHPLYLGPTEDIAYLKSQQRLTFSRAGLGDPLCLDNYRALGGFVGLQRALEMTPQAIVDEVKDSGLRGRGGAAFPAGIKWQTVLNTPGEQKYIVCNADEGDSGTFADRVLMEADPYQLIEGMIIAGLAVGATRGYIYLRSEYPKAHEMLKCAIEKAEQAGYLGQSVMASDHSFELQVRLGGGAYICGEETSLLDSLEGKRGMVRAKPPLPAIEGLFGKPTVVNNVLTLAAISTILEKGADHYQGFGLGRSRGTLAFQLAGNIKRGGLIELAFGTTLRDVVQEFGGGSYSGRPIRAIQVGGPLGAYLPDAQWDTPLDYESFAAQNAMVGHGGIVVFDDTVDMGAQARFAMEFCAEESCGKCTPCRIGSVRGVEVIDRILADDNREDNLIVLHDLCDTLEFGSLCAMGGMTPFPVRSALHHFPEDFAADRVVSKDRSE